MARLGPVIVAASMVVISASFGAVLYLGAGLGVSEAIVCAIAALTGFALCGIVARSRRVETVPNRSGDLTRGVSDLARQVAELGRRVVAVETKAADAAERAERAEATAEPLGVEINEIGALIKQLAEAVNAHDLALQSGGTLEPEPAIVPPPLPASPPPFAAPAKAEPVTPPPLPLLRVPAVAGFKGLSVPAATAAIAEAIGANRLEFHLQPIVTLPQRKVRFYEALARLRTADGELVAASDFLEIAEAGHLIARVDNQMLFRCVKVVRRLLAKSREIGLFCNISAATLADGEFFAEFAEFLEANRSIAASLVFEFTQSAYRSFGPIENESLAALRSWGFRFSMDHVGDLKLEPRDLAERGFRFLKVPAALLLDRAAGGAADIHAADLSSLLTRFGIELIAERIESEGTVVDLLDYDVKYGQGFLFSAPRPVRSEVMQAAAERAEDSVGASAEQPLPREPAEPAARAAEPEARPDLSQHSVAQLAFAAAAAAAAARAVRG